VRDLSADCSWARILQCILYLCMFLEFNMFLFFVLLCCGFLLLRCKQDEATPWTPYSLSIRGILQDTISTWWRYGLICNVLNCKAWSQLVAACKPICQLNVAKCAAVKGVSMRSSSYICRVTRSVRRNRSDKLATESAVEHAGNVVCFR